MDGQRANCGASLMHVAIMGRSVRPQSTGVGRHAGALVEALSRLMPAGDLTVFLTADASLRAAGTVRTVRAPRRVTSEYTRALWEQLIVPRQASRLGVELYHSPNYILPVAGLRCPTVVTVHDLTFLDRSLHRLRSHLYLGLLTRIALRTAAAVIAVSEHTKQALERRFPLVAHKTEVIYQGIGPGLIPQVQSADGGQPVADFPYLLHIGTLEPRKNHLRLIEAFERAAEQGGLPHHLVLIGPEGWKTKELHAALRNSPVRDRIHRIGYVGDEQLARWYRGAELFVYPSTEEGFGLPVLEAMALGVPVLTSNRSALPELVGDAAVTCDPYAIESIARQIQRILGDADLSERLRAAGRERARRFTWDQAAARHLELYERVVEQAGQG